MNRHEEWGKTGYDDILERYRIPKKHLYFILDEPDISVVRNRLRKSLAGLKEIRVRYEFIKKEVNKKRS